MKRAIITGPTGAIGMALIEQLTQNGTDVVAVIRPDSTRADRIQESEHVHVVRCALKDMTNLPQLVEGSADVFYHFAWDGTFGDSRNDMYLQNNNVRYALDAVNAAKKLGCSVFIGAGSQAEYGRFEGKLDSHVPAFPENGYGIAKLCAGQMTRVECEKKGIRHIWTRILSIYGAYDGEKTMVSSTAIKLLNGEKPSCTKGEQLWDYMYSKDAARAFELLADKGKDGKVYCLGSGNARPLRGYIEDIRRAVGCDVEIGFGEVPYGEKQVMHLCADISELTADTGFVPKYTFKEGIAQTVDWWRRQLVDERR